MRPTRTSRLDCRVVEPEDICPYGLSFRSAWVRYEEIAREFATHASASHLTKVPLFVVDADLKVLVRDSGTRPLAVLTAERVYPKRALVGPALECWDIGMAYFAVAVLNSAIGCAEYRRRAATRSSRKGDVLKEVVAQIPVPLPVICPNAYRRAALLSYRLHCLVAANANPAVDLHPVIREQELRLLLELARCFDLPDGAVRELIAREHPATLADGPTLPFRQDARVADHSLLPEIVFLNEEQRAECRDLRRAEHLGDEQFRKLQRLEELIRWETRANSSVPRRLPVSEWRGVETEQEALKAAHRYLSHKKGQRYGAEEPRRAAPDLWQVSYYYSPPKGTVQDQDTVGRLPSAWAVPGKHFAGSLWIDAITGDVREVAAEGVNAVTARP